MINTLDLHKNFGDKEVLKGITITATKGEILGVLGPSGAGKTTLIEIMMGHLKQDRGESKLFGVDSLNLKDEQLNKIGSVLDESGLFDRLTCKQNLEIFRKIHGIPRNKINAVLEKVGLGKSENVPVNKLSKGMTQRLVLARAIMHQPELLFLDEPTSGLDPTTSKEIHKLLLELKFQGTTILLVTHNMQEATDLCDNVAFLFNGKIIEYDQPKAICAKYATQKKYNISLKDGCELTLTDTLEDNSKISSFFEQGIVESISSSLPTLGDVFIELTGKELI